MATFTDLRLSETDVEAVLEFGGRDLCNLDVLRDGASSGTYGRIGRTLIGRHESRSLKVELRQLKS
jgi:hypothetical protein